MVPTNHQLPLMVATNTNGTVDPPTSADQTRPGAVSADPPAGPEQHRPHHQPTRDPAVQGHGEGRGEQGRRARHDQAVGHGVDRDGPHHDQGEGRIPAPGDVEETR